MKAYLLVFNNVGPVGRQAIQDFLDTKPAEVKNWYTCFSHGIVIVSEKSLLDLQSLIHARFPSNWFLLAEVNQDNTNGWAPKLLWEFINNPTPQR